MKDPYLGKRIAFIPADKTKDKIMGLVKSSLMDGQRLDLTDVSLILSKDECVPVGDYSIILASGDRIMLMD